jgi:hypothetical protein
MGWIGCILWENFRHDFVACITCTSLAHFAPSFAAVIKQSQMHLNTMKRSKTCGYGPMQWIGCARCEKLWRDFVAWTFALIAPVQPVLHRVYCRNKTIPNAPGHYETHQNLSLGSYGLDRVCSLRKFLTQLRGTNFCINCTNSAHFAPRFMHSRNGPKCTQTLRNATKHEFGVQWGGSGAFVGKIPMQLSGTNFCISCTVCPFCTEFPAVKKWFQMHPITMKRTKTWD